MIHFVCFDQKFRFYFSKISCLHKQRSGEVLDPFKDWVIYLFFRFSPFCLKATFIGLPFTKTGKTFII